VRGLDGEAVPMVRGGAAQRVLPADEGIADGQVGAGRAVQPARVRSSEPDPVPCYLDAGSAGPSGLMLSATTFQAPPRLPQATRCFPAPAIAVPSGAVHSTRYLPVS